MLGGTRGPKKRQVVRAFRTRLKSQGRGFQLGGETERLGDGNGEVSLGREKKKEEEEEEGQRGRGREREKKKQQMEKKFPLLWGRAV